jgi:hypothetical protein
MPLRIHTGAPLDGKHAETENNQLDNYHQQNIIKNGISI